jgi:alanine dehydrogenase
MSLLKVAVFGSANKTGEKRIPIHPDQFEWIDSALRAHLFFEEDYGLNLGVSNNELRSTFGGVVSRNELFDICDVMLLPKPTIEDLKQMKPGTILWGWPHCVQQRDIAQLAIDKKLTLIAWEAMHRWNSNGAWQMHIFQNNNELAGYAGVLHALGLVGIDGNYGPNKIAVVLSFGSVSRGAIHALKGMGIQEINIYTQRNALFVADQVMGLNYRHYEENENGKLMAISEDGSTIPFIDALSDADIIINGILQNTDHPLTFVYEEEIDQLKQNSIIIDISCDEGMGFSFAKPTSFKEPLLRIKNFNYYAVDHTPSYLWNSASWEISKVLIPYLEIIMNGPDRWQKNETIRRATEIKDGHILNPKILSFQNRETTYPYRIK